MKSLALNLTLILICNTRVLIRHLVLNTHTAASIARKQHLLNGHLDGVGPLLEVVPVVVAVVVEGVKTTFGRVVTSIFAVMSRQRVVVVLKSKKL